MRTIVGFYVNCAILVLGAAACFLYTSVLFGPTNAASFIKGVSLYLAYVGLIISITLGLSTVFSVQVVAGGLSVVFILIFSLLAALDTGFAQYTPGALGGVAGEIVATGSTTAPVLGAVIGSLALTAGVLAVTVWLFHRQEF